MAHAKKFLFCVICFFFCNAAPIVAQNTEIRFVTWKAEAPKVWDQAVADFERQNPGIKVGR